MKPSSTPIAHVCGIAALVHLLAGISHGQPAAPIGLSVFPRYQSPIVLVVQWTDNSTNEDGFRIERRQQGSAAWTLATLLPASPGRSQQEWIDNTAGANQYWEYRIAATSTALGDSAFTAASYGQTPRQVWPINNGDHDILHSFGTPLDFDCGGGTRCQYLHEGVDISAGGSQVDAAQGGTIVSINNPPTSNGGGLRIEVDWGPPTNTEFITYQHVVVDATWNVGDAIAAGDRIGTVNTGYFGRAPDADHVHWGTRNWNILTRYAANADRDPNQAWPSVVDINTDGRAFIVVDAAVNDHTRPREPAWGDVDLLLDASDDMAPNLPTVVNPFRLGYWIHSRVAGADDVRSAASPYRLAEFSFTIPGPQGNQFPQNALVYWGLPADIHGINTWQSCLTWILTNTRGTDGARANIDASEFWRTDARGGVGVEPNGSDALHAREIQEARFPDGLYDVHVLLDDLAHRRDDVRAVLLDNSRPYVKRVLIRSGMQLIYESEWLWDRRAALLLAHPSDLGDATAFSAARTEDVAFEVEFSEPMRTAAIASISPLNRSVAMSPNEARTVWTGLIVKAGIADDGSDDGLQMLSITGTDLAGNGLLQVQSRSRMPADHHSRDSFGVLRGAAGLDTVHGFRVGPLEGVLPVDWLVPVLF